MDSGIINRIRENEKEYHGAVMKYLREKESELRNVLRRLDEKNNQSDGKDILIGKLHTLVSKIEADAKFLMTKMNNNMAEIGIVRDTMTDMNRDHAFLKEKVRKEKRKR